MGIGRAGAALVKGDELLVFRCGCSEFAFGVERFGRLELKAFLLAEFSKSFDLYLLKPGQFGRNYLDGRKQPYAKGTNQSELFFAVNHRLYSECA